MTNFTNFVRQLDQDIRSSKKIAVAYRSPNEASSEGIGVTVALFYHLNAYVISVEKFRNDGGYGENFSRSENSFETLQAAIDEITQHGFSVEQMKIQLAN